MESMMKLVLRQWRQRLSGRSAIRSRLTRRSEVWIGRIASARPFVTGHGPHSCTVTLRLQGSDIATYVDVMLRESYNPYWSGRVKALQTQYAETLLRGSRPLIIDAGANVGLASAYFLTVYPGALVVAIEPEIGNFKQLSLNVGGEPRVLALNAALGGTRGEAAVVDAGQGDWGFRTERNASNNRVCPLLTMDDVLERANSHFGSPLEPWIAKIDIEGFEADVFEGDTGWVDRFPLLIVELHDWMLPGRGTSRSFLRCMGQSARDFLWCGENVWSIRSHPAPVAGSAVVPADTGSA